VYGRRVTLLLSILLITLPTVLIGCLPSYHMIGIAAPVLLAVFRFVQGERCLHKFVGIYIKTDK
jgi:MHS family proline/betaine transporter-like MFS transporter